MSGLERRVLTVVRKAQQFPLVGANMVLGPIHPAQRARYQKRGRRTPAFGGKARQLVDLARLPRLLVLAVRAEPKLPRQKETALAQLSECSGSAHANAPGKRLTPFSLYPAESARPLLR